MPVLINPPQRDSSSKKTDKAARRALSPPTTPPVSPKVQSSDITERMCNFLRHATEVSIFIIYLFLMFSLFMLAAS
jgi:hypothetical protein